MAPLVDLLHLHIAELLFCTVVCEYVTVGINAFPAFSHCHFLLLALPAIIVTITAAADWGAYAPQQL